MRSIQANWFHPQVANAISYLHCRNSQFTAATLIQRTARHSPTCFRQIDDCAAHFILETAIADGTKLADLTSAQRFLIEGADSSWAPATVAGIYSVLARIQALQIFRTDVECKTTVCKATLWTDDLRLQDYRARREYQNELGAHLAVLFEPLGLEDVTGWASPNALTFYFSRQDAF